MLLCLFYLLIMLTRNFPNWKNYYNSDVFFFRNIIKLFLLIIVHQVFLEYLKIEISQHYFELLQALERVLIIMKLFSSITIPSEIFPKKIWLTRKIELLVLFSFCNIRKAAWLKITHRELNTNQIIKEQKYKNDYMKHHGNNDPRRITA